MANRFADKPEPVRMLRRTPSLRAIARSKSSLLSPSVSQKSSVLRVAASTSSGPNTCPA